MKMERQETMTSNEVRENEFAHRALQTESQVVAPQLNQSNDRNQNTDSKILPAMTLTANQKCAEEQGCPTTLEREKDFKSKVAEANSAIKLKLTEEQFQTFKALQDLFNPAKTEVYSRESINYIRNRVSNEGLATMLENVNSRKEDLGILYKTAN